MFGILDKIFEDLGIKTETLSRVRLGRGVIGKSATVAVWALIVLGIVAYRLKVESFLIVIGVAAFVLFLIFFIGSMIYGSRNPSAALLEGAELIAWQKQELAAKNMPNPPKGPIVLDPKGPVPQIEETKPDKL